MKKFLIFCLAAGCQLLLQGQSPKENKQLLIRLDDLGFSHAANTGAEKIFRAGFPVSVSVMAPGPWFEEAVKIIKKYPQVSVGVHLTLNAEWENYKWGPVSGPSAVPSLVDSNGYFPWKVTWFYKDIMKIEEMEKELTAQIEKVVRSGLKIDYIDGHMGACGMTPEQKDLMKKLAARYHVFISGDEGEHHTKGVEAFYNRPGDFLNTLDSLTAGITLMVNHPGDDTPEMQALMVQTDKPDPSQAGMVAKQRAAVAAVLSSEEFKKKIEKNNITLINYRMLKTQKQMREKTK